MLRPPGFKFLMLSIAFPGASWALGLGDIHVESALHQPLAAQIEIVGATADSSAGLSATIADEETFKRYGLERPVALSSTALTVRQDKLGHPVLVLRSTDTYPEPMVTFLVDLHSRSGELIREYTVLLDPPDLMPEHGAVETASATESQPSPTATQLPATEALAPTIHAKAQEPTAPAQDVIPTPDTYTIARRDTLARIATIAGAHSANDRRKMMVAIYRANPGAFQTNLNMLRTGATLHLPSVADSSKIPAEEANREFAQQMSAWRAAHHHGPSVVSAPTSLAVPANTAVAKGPATDSARSLVVADARPGSASNDAETAALTERVKSLEKSLHDLQEDLKQPPAPAASAPVALTVTPPTSARAPAAVAAPAITARAVTSQTVTSQTVATEESQSDDDAPAPVPHRGTRAIAIAGGIGLALAAGAWILWIYRRRQIEREGFFGEAVAAPRVELEFPVHLASNTSRGALTTHAPRTTEPTHSTPPQFPAIDMSASYLVEELQHDTGQASAADEVSADPKTDDAATGETVAGDTISLDTTAEVTTTASTTVAGRSATSISVDAEALALLEEASLAAGIGGAPDEPAVAHEPTVKIVKPPRALDAETTAILALPADLMDDAASREFDFFNPESANNTTHVTLAGALGEPPKFFVERRKNPIDVLRQAIEREPDRSDLRLKLLELYYTAAAQNRRAFLDAARQLAKNEALASSKDWSQITDMGRSIAPDDDLFNNGLDKQAVA